MAVKPRTVWFSDEEWALLKTHAKETGETVSGVIRGWWTAAARPKDATADRFNTRPFTPVPKR